MKNGKAVGKRLTEGRGRGYPWSVILDAEGKALISSDGPEGNIGCPVTPGEAAHFFAMLEKTRQRLTDEELAILKTEHAAFAKPILEASSRR